MPSPVINGSTSGRNAVLSAPSATLVSEDVAPLAQLRAGNESAFLRLVQRNHRAMIRGALTYVPSEAIAEEVAQEAWVGIFQGLDKFEGRCPLRTWMFRILANIAKEHGEREARTVPFSALESGDCDCVPPPERFCPHDDPRWLGRWAHPPEPWEDERLADAEALRQVRAEVDRLPPNSRRVITLRDIEHRDSAEVCEALGISETNQRVLLHRARTKVRKALAGNRPGL